jgi:PAS domain S-box-containing protein
MISASWIDMIHDTLLDRAIIFDRFGNLIYCNQQAFERIFSKNIRNIANAYPAEWPLFNEVLLTDRARLGIQLKGIRLQKVTLDVYPINNQKKNKGLLCWLRKEEDHDELLGFKQLSEELTAMMDSSFDGIWICDNKANVIHINKAYERNVGIKAEDYIGRNMDDLVQEGFVDSSVTLKVLKEKRMITDVQITKDGRRVLSTGNPVYDQNGEIVMVICNDRDLSVLENLREEILSKKDLSSRHQEELIDFQAERLAEQEIIHRSPLMSRVIERAIKVAQSHASVLVTGPSGSGKEGIAELIHQRSDRFKEKMVRVNCGAIPESLFESEMFGHEYGAFTGAKREGKMGLVESADKGTLFLDEIAEMPQSVQVKLLRFLDNGLVFRVGAIKGRKADVRIIAATNQNLENLVQKKHFREDLYYRLKVVPIQIPPLKSRPEDIPPLIEHYVKYFNLQAGKEKILTPEAIDYLVNYEFPGNVRELVNMCERLVVMTSGNHITPDHLPHVVMESFDHSGSNDLNKTVQYKASLGSPLRAQVEAYEKEILTLAMEKYHNQKEIAKALEVNESTITRKLRKYSLTK